MTGETSRHLLILGGGLLTGWLMAATIYLLAHTPAACH